MILVVLELVLMWVLRVLQPHFATTTGSTRLDDKVLPLTDVVLIRCCVNEVSL